MPRAFLVKKQSVSPGKRNWSQLPDHERGDIYVPGSMLAPLGCEECEACPAEVALSLSVHRQMSKNSWVETHDTHTAELPSHSAQVQKNNDSVMESRSRAQNIPYIRSKIKVTTGELPCDSPSPPLAPTLPASPTSGSASFTCQVCQKVFQFQRMLNRHLKCHNETKRHPCNFCGKGFNDTFDLKRHVRTHTGVRPYKCSVCEKAFTQRCSLESHMRKIHGVTQHYAYKERRAKLYVCEECGHTSHTQDALLRHIHTLHPHSAFLRAKCARKLSVTHRERSSSPASPHTQHFADSEGPNE